MKKGFGIKNFEVIFIRCCPCFVDFISHVMRLDNGSCFTSIEFVDFVRPSKQGPFATETFTMPGTILLTCFNDLVTTFVFDEKNCLCYKRRTFFSCKVSDHRTILWKFYRYYRKSLKELLVNFLLFIRLSLRILAREQGHRLRGLVAL